MRVARIIVRGEWPSLICFARSLWWLDQGQWGQAGKQTRKPRQEVGGFHVVAHGACTVAFRRVGTNLRIIVWFMMPFVRNLTSTESSKARTSRLASSVRFLVGWLWTSILIPCYFPVGNLMMNVLKGGCRLGPPPCAIQPVISNVREWPVQTRANILTFCRASHPYAVLQTLRPLPQIYRTFYW